MKSIKEKAKEYGKAMLTDWGVVSTERIEGFEAGADYVLGEIENQLDEFYSFEDSLMVIRVIEQLKK